MISIYHPGTLTRIYNVVRSTSIQWTRRFYDVGSFTIVLPANTPGKEYLQKYNLIAYKHNVGIILYRKQTANEIEVRGCDLKGLCDRRQVVPPFVYMDNPIDPIYSHDRIKGNAETAMRHYITTQMISPTDTARSIANLILATNQNRGDQIAWQAKFTSVAEELRKMGLFAELGWDIALDKTAKKLVFDCKRGTNRASSVVFSRNFRNIGDYAYEQDALDEVNTVYVGGNGDEEEQYVEKVANSAYTGIYRAEGCTSIGSDDVEEVEDGGYAYLEEKKEAETVSAEAGEKLRYNQDWFLGDYVTVKVDTFGDTYTTQKQITEVSEVYEPSNISVTPTFGNAKESIIKKLLKG